MWLIQLQDHAAHYTDAFAGPKRHQTIRVILLRSSESARSSSTGLLGSVLSEAHVQFLSSVHSFIYVSIPRRSWSQTQNSPANETYQHGPSAPTTSLWIYIWRIHGNNILQSLALFWGRLCVVYGRLVCGLVTMWLIVVQPFFIDYTFAVQLIPHTHTHTLPDGIFPPKLKGSATSTTALSWQIFRHVSLLCGWLEMTLTGDRNPDEGKMVIFPPGSPFYTYHFLFLSLH